MTPPKRIVMTGATGFVGSQVVPILLEKGVEVLVVSRDPMRAPKRFPNCRTIGYDALADEARDTDVLVHMATRNNDRGGDDADFRAANVDLFRRVLDTACAAGIGLVVHLSSLHALDPADASPYAKSKREADALARATVDPRVVTLHLAAVYGRGPDGAHVYAGRLKTIERLPNALRPVAFACLSALRPTLSADRLAEHLLMPPGEDAILSDGQRDNTVYAAITAILDVVVAAAIFILLFWLLLLIWAAVRLDSRGPGLFVQERVGRDGKHFSCWKFRTMRVGVQQAGTHELSGSAVTRVGRILRPLKLDELPQAWNLLNRSMSIVGPRPCLPVQRELVDARDRRGVLDIRPGITGLSQVEDIDMSTPCRLARRDADYVALRSIPLDLKLMVRTVGGGGRGDRTDRMSDEPR
ncbi:sugar transferase [Jannaschia sp. LMIT008]|uniref:sugar transferase n=1 Tax=Jannaschia maritima TaxID=3032585 RepID=UPI002812447D|nr:sugar transferase [Jannaschia sp. LMIT008]